MPLLLENKLVTINKCDDVGNIPSKGEMIDYEDKLKYPHCEVKVHNK